MKKVIRFIRKHWGPMYLGGAMAAIGHGLTTWQYWVIVVPVIVWYVMENE